MSSSSSTGSFISAASSSSSSVTEEIICYCPFHKEQIIPCRICGWKFPVGKLQQITVGPLSKNQQRTWKIGGAIIFRTQKTGTPKLLLLNGWLLNSVRSWFEKRIIIYKKIKKNKGIWKINKK